MFICSHQYSAHSAPAPADESSAGVLAREATFGKDTTSTEILTSMCNNEQDEIIDRIPIDIVDVLEGNCKFFHDFSTVTVSQTLYMFVCVP